MKIIKNISDHPPRPSSQHLGLLAKLVVLPVVWVNGLRGSGAGHTPDKWNLKDGRLPTCEPSLKVGGQSPAFSPRAWGWSSPLTESDGLEVMLLAFSIGNFLMAWLWW